MKRMFDIENPFNSFMTRVFDLALLNVLWFLTSIPVFTIGASATALCSMTLKMVQDKESAIAKGFFEEFRKNFKAALPVTFILVLCTSILVADFHILREQKSGTAAIMYGGCITLAVLLVSIFSYLFPLLARFENTTRRMFGNAARLALCYLPQTVAMAALNLIPFVWFLLSPETFSRIFWIWFFIGTAVVVYLNSWIITPILERLEKEAQDTAD